MKPYPSKQAWTPGALRTLHTMCSNRRPVRAIAERLNRTEGAVRQQARRNGLSVGVAQRGVATSRRRYSRAKKLGLV